MLLKDPGWTRLNTSAHVLLLVSIVCTSPVGRARSAAEGPGRQSKEKGAGKESQHRPRICRQRELQTRSVAHTHRGKRAIKIASSVQGLATWLEQCCLCTAVVDLTLYEVDAVSSAAYALPIQKPWLTAPHSEATPEGRRLRGQALMFATFTVLLTPGHCGPLTPPQALKFGDPQQQFFVRKPSKVWKAPMHALQSNAPKFQKSPSANQQLHAARFVET
eukprot:498230-Pelagomonas_calceolata.AAC.3